MVTTLAVFVYQFAPVDGVKDSLLLDIQPIPLVAAPNVTGQ
jgi:hypothetical protein